MKRLEIAELESIKGGGCMKWIRRYRRAVNRGDNEEVLDALMDAFDACIDAQY